MKMSKRQLWWAAFVSVIIVLLLIMIIPRLRSRESVSAPDYWPTQSWRSCPPEEQGMDSGKLAEGILAIRENNINIHSLLIIRDGKVVLDANFYPYNGKTVHEIASVTKSLMTTLIGIAADQGKLKLDQPMVSFFPELTIANRDAQKEKITVRHLVSMTSGLDSLGLAQDEGTLAEMESSADWVQFALDRPVVSEPGTKFVYDSPGMHLLSAILQQATGMTALEFAQENLFAPLGIRDAIWPTDPQGYNHGWGDLYLYPRDVAKLGYLWLSQGVWEGQQIISREWVENAVKLQIETGGGDDYGYGWWVLHGTTPGEFAAIGRGGQRVQVIPALNAIIATTGGGFDIDEIMPYLIPALIDTSNPLPENPQGVAELSAAIVKVSQAPAPQPIAPLSATARAISGKTYLLEDNPAQLKTMRLEFSGSAEASLQVTSMDDQTITTQLIGLDGIYRLSPGEHGLPQGARGYWADGQTFLLEIDEIAVNDHTNYRIVFQDDQVVINGLETAHELSTTIKGRQQQ